MEIALIGLTSSGKTALFEALTGVAGTSTGHGAHHGILTVPDERVDKLAEILNSKKKTFTNIDLVDIAGLSPASGQSAQYNDRILGEVREADGLLFVVRTFRSASASHPSGSVDPKRDLSALLGDLHVSDLGIIEKRLEKLDSIIARLPKDQRDRHIAEQRVLGIIRDAIEEGTQPDLSDVTDADLQTVKGYGFFSLKPGLVVANVGDLTDLDEKADLDALENLARDLGLPLVPINAALEGELRDFPPEERAEYYREMGLPGSAVESLISTVYRGLDVETFLTAGETESRAWPLVRGSTAPEAAGTVHTDMQRGFIRAEVVAYDDLVASGSMAEAKKHGQVRLEGKDYIVQDGDVIFFHFSK